MLTQDIITKIEQFVHAKPRTIQEIAQLLDKNWRTADRYIEEIQKNYGTIGTRTFREGTRGALKLVFWAGFEKASKSIFQEELEKEILKGRRKEDFSPFDIYQYVPDDKRDIKISTKKSDLPILNEELANMLVQAKKRVICFSGDLSYLNNPYKQKIIFDAFEVLVKNNIPIKVICRVDIIGREKVEKLLSLNFKYGKELIEIHHREQPLRGVIIDDTICRLKEIRIDSETDNKWYMYYTLTQKDWCEWLVKIFFHMFSTSIDAKLRLQSLNKIPR